ncbi:TPA: peptidylprolyl isomerase [Candidatus Poribacteria bacterium]|nr:peptidylprolyl isomerase [Candidatus Poribacteria bacterium]HEX30313.1 peptidylprolyl isomerase [Candidatus Poribacteria bacterium]
MAQAKRGDTVKVHYTGKLEDGTVFDTSLDRPPLQFTIGEGRLIPGFEEAVIGMSPGESKTVKVPADRAFGPHYEEMVLVVDRAEFPEHIDPEIGQQLQISQMDGRTIIVTVTDVSESTVTLDANHPLAGKDLIFDIKLLEIA